MKKILYIFLVLSVLVGLGYYFVKIDKSKTGETLNNQKTTYSKSDIGLEFDYRIGPTGYVLEERIPVDLGDLVKVIIFHRAEDFGREMPVGGEGPAVMTISVFNNTKKQFSRDWADKNIQYSNINLKFGDVVETVVGGANAVRYMADGLYASENVVVAHGDNVYVVTGQFMDQNSDIRRDFAPLIDSIKFIPKSGQE